MTRHIRRIPGLHGVSLPAPPGYTPPPEPEHEPEPEDKRGTPWTPDEDAQLREFFADHSVPIREIAPRIGRSERAVVNRSRLLGLKRPRRHPEWTPEQREKARRMRAGGATCATISEALGTPPRTVHHRLARITGKGE